MDNPPSASPRSGDGSAERTSTRGRRQSLADAPRDGPDSLFVPEPTLPFLPTGHLPHAPRAGYDAPRNDGDPTGPLATTSCEPRQARKGAAAAADSGAGVWLVGSPPADSKRVRGNSKEPFVLINIRNWRTLAAAAPAATTPLWSCRNLRLGARPRCCSGLHFALPGPGPLWCGRPRRRRTQRKQT